MASGLLLLPQPRRVSRELLNGQELQRTRRASNKLIRKLAIPSGSVEVAVWLDDNIAILSGFSCRETDHFIDIYSADLTPSGRRSFIRPLFERRARLTRFPLPVGIVIEVRVDLTFYSRQADRQNVRLALRDDYSTLVQRLPEATSRLRVMANFRP